MPDNFDDMKPYTEAVEWCADCDNQNVYPGWDVKTQGYVAVCQHCGRELMLCDECFHTDENGDSCECNDYCDWHEDPVTGESTCYRKSFLRKEIKTMKNFNDVCEYVNAKMFEDWDGNCSSAMATRRVLTGSDKDKAYLYDRINELLRACDFDVDTSTIPTWYQNMSVEGAILNELYGWGPIAEWFTDDYKDSSHFIVEDGRCFIMRDGHIKLMKQIVSENFTRRIEKAFSSPEERLLLDTFKGVHLIPKSSGCFVLERPVPCKVTKQDITLQLWADLLGTDTFDKFDSFLDPSCVDTCVMRKTNSFGIKLKDGREFKVVVKDMGEDD